MSLIGGGDGRAVYFLDYQIIAFTAGEPSHQKQNTFRLLQRPGVWQG